MATTNDQPVWVDHPDAAPTARAGLPVVVIGAGPIGLAAAAHLLDRGLEPLDLDALPTGADLLEHYLEPLAALPALAGRIHLHTTVVAVARHQLDKVRSPGRDRLPFLVRFRDPDGRLRDLQARAVIDASGTWAQPNPLGASGLPAL